MSYSMKCLLVLQLMLLLTATIASAAQPKKEKLQITDSCGLSSKIWLTDLDQAVVQAKEKKVPIYIFYTEKGCGWCDIEKKKLLTNPAFENWANKSAVLYYIYLDPSDDTVLKRTRTEYQKLQKLCPEFFQYAGYPNIRMMWPTGELVFSEKIRWFNYGLDKNLTGKEGILKSLINKKLIPKNSTEFDFKLVPQLNPDLKIFTKHMNDLVDASRKSVQPIQK